MATQMPEWRQSGRIKDLPFPSIIESLRQGILKTVCFAEYMESHHRIASWKIWTYLILIAGLFVLALKQWKLISPLVLLAASGLVFFLIARLKAFQLGFPSRFLDYPVIAAVILLWPVCFSFIQTRFKNGKILFAYVSAIVAVLLIFRPINPIFKEQALNISKHEDLLNHIKNNDETMLIAGWPKSPTDDIPLFCQKEVFVDYEHAHPLYLNYYDAIRSRLIDLVRLTFATNELQAASIRDRYGLSHLLVQNSSVRLKIE
jgi:hypothetical protein